MKKKSQSESSYLEHTSLVQYYHPNVLKCAVNQKEKDKTDEWAKDTNGRFTVMGETKGQ